ncbi:MAG: hypothetical protein IH616_10025, partial [Gemmatimonadales bacterium]|nr:hypothetical protein [Gemmatimonadales bacterium]
VVGWALAGRRAALVSAPAVDAAAETPRAPSRDARLVFGLIVAYAFARMPETLLLLRLQEVGISLAGVPVLWAALHVVRSAASYPGGWLGDVVGSRRTMALGWLIYAGVCGGLARSTSLWAAGTWFLVFGLVAGATEGPERSFIAGAGGAARRGSRFGVYHASVGLAALPGSLLLGGVYAAAGGPVALAVSGAVAAVLAIVAWSGVGVHTPQPSVT